ncbi:hypothetical protein [Saccharomonospora sp. CUA-673]|uniref:hypothetical protein n=1 Tax=Saccharomonospora sp. CUA-673 TaxID=1904969 RepID=UPI0011153E04|nr:hypothetical protein [Saccharomonospora sp. CUA-673]
MTDLVTLPAELVGQPGHVSRHCTRHGEPAARYRDFKLQSSVKLEGSRWWSANVLTMSSDAGDYAKKVKVAEVTGWPLCSRCLRMRARWMVVAAVLFYGGLLAVASPFVAAIFVDVPGWMAGVGAAGFVALPVSAWPFSRGSIPRVIGARTSADGAFVVVRSPSSEFVSGLPDGEWHRGGSGP